LPVFIYKYGKVLSGVSLRWRQRKLTKLLALRMTFLQEKYGGDGERRPDVIAHSFGTWLIGHVLSSHPQLLVGRVILCGSILRPDFDWERLIQRGQVEAVLNHCAERDRWVPLAEYLIPDSGPSGVRGFVQSRVVHRAEKAFRHSSFFYTTHLESMFRDVWNVFLTRPINRLLELSNAATAPEWRRLPALRELVRCVALSIAAVLTASLVVSVAVGIVTLEAWIT
jgi:pimeloyl-ACP methyl ester carboxylesterase